MRFLLIRFTYLSIRIPLLKRCSLEKIHTNLGSNYELTLQMEEIKTMKVFSEIKICKKLNIGLIDGLGEKISSSSWLLKN